MCLTAIMKEQHLKMNDLQCATVSQEGKFWRSTSMPPDSEEEQACIEATSLSLKDENDNMLENNEDMLAATLVNDGGTRGGLKFMSRQSESIGSASKNT